MRRGLDESGLTIGERIGARRAYLDLASLLSVLLPCRVRQLAFDADALALGKVGDDLARLPECDAVDVVDLLLFLPVLSAPLLVHGDAELDCWSVRLRVAGEVSDKEYAIHLSCFSCA